MRTKILVGMLFVVLLGGLFSKQQFAYPQAWNEIQLGMSRQEVYDRTGTPSANMGEIKGAFWFQNKLTQQQELWVYFDKDIVTSLGITRRIGTTEHFHTRIVRSESLPLVQ